MEIPIVLFYALSGIEPKFHLDGIKNKWFKYKYLNIGKFQVRRIFDNDYESRFGRCEAVFVAEGFKTASIIPKVLIY